MSSPSDNENAKHTDEESLSDKESFADEQKGETKKIAKKKRKSKELPKAPGKFEDLKSCPGTSKNSKTCFENEPGKKIDSSVMCENSDSNSGEKHVGVVRDNIKHLNLNEEDKLKDSEKDNLKPAEIPAEVGTSLGISIVSQSHLLLESGRLSDNQNVQPPPPPPPSVEQDSLINASDNDPLYELIPFPITSDSSEDVCADAPPNTLNEPGDSLELRADLHQLPSNSKAYRRKAFAQRTDDTLDDVSEIISDIADIPSDSSLEKPIFVQTSRRTSQETSSDAKAEDLNESLGLPYKTVADITKEKSNVSNQSVKESNGSKDAEDHCEANKNLIGEQENTGEKLTVGNIEGEINSPEEHGNGAKECEQIATKLVSNGQDNANKTSSNNDGNGHNLRSEFKEQHSGSEQVDVENQDVSNEQRCEQKHRSDFFNQTSENPKLKESSSKQENTGEKVNYQIGDEPMEEQDCSVGLDDPDNDMGERNALAEPVNEEKMVDLVVEQQAVNMDGEDQVHEQDNSSEQDGSNVQHVASEQGSNSNSDYQNFARGQYVRFPIDSTTTDSGIENSLAIFDPSYLLDINENQQLLGEAQGSSESNDASALGASAAELQNLQNWMDRGAAEASNQAASVPLLPQSKERVPCPSNLNERDGPSTSFGNRRPLGVQMLNVAKLETIEDVPMECAEQFADTPSEGSILEIPDVRMKSEDVIEDLNTPKPTETDEVKAKLDKGPNLFQSNDGEKKTAGNENLTVISTSSSSLQKSASDIVDRKSTSSGSDNKEIIPDIAVDEENNPIQGDEESAANKSTLSSLNPKTSQRLAREDSDNISSSSPDQSRDSSLADMDDAIESSDSLSRETEMPQTMGTNTNLLQTLAERNIELAKESGAKPQRIKRRARKSGENNSPLKRRKDVTTCGQQAGAAMDSSKRQNPDSDDESSKEDRKFRG